MDRRLSLKPSTNHTKALLRHKFISARSDLDDAERVRLDAQICKHVLQSIKQEPLQRIAAYVAFRGEPNLNSVLLDLHRKGHQIHLPVLNSAGMQFRHWRPGVMMYSNRYGIPEPSDGTICVPEQLDTVLMPLVAFDRRGGRLGMGGGYYDRSFECLQPPPTHRPRLIGIAYDLQCLNSEQDDLLPAEPWDVVLDAVVTEHGLRSFRSG